MAGSREEVRVKVRLQVRLYRFSFILPESMTYTTSSMVTEVSAMLVEMMILVTPSGGRQKTACCSSLVKVECSGYTTHLEDGAGVSIFLLPVVHLCNTK